MTFDGLGDHAFEDDRAGGQHPFDQAQYQGAKILLVNENFGCGASREHAPQALMRWGLGAFVGQSFAEIFFGNCVALGLPCATVSAEDAARLQDSVEADPAQELTLDVAAQTITYKEGAIQCAIPDGPREQFVSGTWDALRQLLDAGSAIDDTAAQLPYATAFQST